ncbi:MAG: hypothetical protein CMJ65_13975 [Planctomycetaceae bacterium]|jgi:hypothetical protein|nr:hypothetical protein [Planctomycetaceae bacterium]
MQLALSRLLLTILITLLPGLSGIVSAQEFGVYTRVFNLAGSKPKAPPRIIVRSLTLFRSGKAYDSIHSAGEVTVFEPARRRFVILNGPRRLATEVSFSEIKNSLQKAESATREYVAQLRRNGDPDSLAAVGPLQAQLDPGFSEQYDRASSILILPGRAFQYRVGCTATPSTPGVDRMAFGSARQRYLEYADWIARLNYLLHPRALFPAPRVVLNNSLRSRKLLPLTVELRAHAADDFHLRAEHQFHWQLTGKDRDDIRHWESLLLSETLKRVKFSEYRRRLISRR